MAKDIDPKLRKIGEYLKLADDAVFVIPEYQRPYSWSIENCDKLWQDIVDFYESTHKDNYFFGTVIINCDDKEGSTKLELIDGQQRTTTFLLLLKALLIKINSEISKFNNKDDESSGLFNGLIERRKTIMNILYKAEAEEISLIPNLESDSKLYKRVNILINNANNESYKEELNTILKAVDYNDAQENAHKIKYKQSDNRFTNFFRNFKHFYEKINSGEFNVMQINAITKSLLETCEIIEIKSWKVDQAINMFNSLNSDGMPLSDADIIHSKLYAVSKSNKNDCEFSSIWKELLEQVDILKKAGVLDINSILMQYMYLVRAQKKQIVSEGGAIDVTVPGVRRYFTSKENGLMDNPIGTSSQMLKLAQIWNKISEYPIITILLRFNENAKLFLGIYFNRFLDSEINKNEIELLAEIMLKLFVILELVDAGYSSKNFKTFLFKESLKLVNKEISIKEIVEDFNQHIRLNWKAEDVKAEICDYDRNLLVYLNEYLFAKEKGVPFCIGQKYDIEHIMPASGHNLPEIMKDAEIENLDEFNIIVNKLGNKILLEQKINRTIGNEWFRTKISFNSLGKQSYANSEYPIAKSIANHYKNIERPYWNKNDIESATQKAIRRISNFIFED